MEIRGRKIPDSFFENNALEVLELKAYNVSKIPPQIGKLTALKNLTLYVNKIAKFPKEMAQITGLVDITLAMKDGAKIPDFVGQQKQLKHLHILNGIKQIPQALKKLPNLRSITAYPAEDCTEEEVKQLKETMAAINK